MADNKTVLVPEPYAGNRFWVEISGVAEAFFTECNGLQIETEVFEYKEGGLNTFVHKLPVRTKYSNITLKRGFGDSNALWDWYAGTLKGKVMRKSISILLYAPGKPDAPAKRWNVQDAYPIKWVGPELKATNGSYLIETLELVHSGFSLAQA